MSENVYERHEDVMRDARRGCFQPSTDACLQILCPDVLKALNLGVNSWES